MASMGTLSFHLKVSLSSRTELRIPYFSWGVTKGSSLRAENRHFSLSNGAGEEGLEVSPLQGELVQQNSSQIVERREAVSSIKLKAVSTVRQELIDINSSSSMCIEATGAKPSEIPFLDASGKEPDNRFLNGRAVAGDLGLLKQTNLDSTSVAPSQDSGLQVSEKYETIEEQLEDLIEPTASSLSFVNVVTPEEDSKPSLPLAGVNVMNVLLAAAECGPWSRTGGLGDVAGALPKALARQGHRVMDVVPKYGDYPEPKDTGVRKRYKVDGQDLEVSYYHAYMDGVDFAFLECSVFRHCQHNIYGGDRLVRRY